MRRPAFSLFEVIVVMGVLGALAGLSIPMFRSFQIRNDLNVTAEQISQAIGRAQLRSQAAENNASWGFRVDQGILYQGTGFTIRNTQYDELYPFPSTITASGLGEVYFARITGRPSATGTIVLTAISGEQRTIDITIDTEGIVTNTSDWLTICHMKGNSCETKSIQDNAWPGHKSHGDFLGPCRDKNGDGDVCD